MCACLFLLRVLIALPTRVNISDLRKGVWVCVFLHACFDCVRHVFQACSGDDLFYVGILSVCFLDLLSWDGCRAVIYLAVMFRPV